MLVTIYEVLWPNLGKISRYLSLDMAVDYAYWRRMMDDHDQDMVLRVSTKRVLGRDALRWIEGIEFEGLCRSQEPCSLSERDWQTMTMADLHRLSGGQSVGREADDDRAEGTCGRQRIRQNGQVEQAVARVAYERKIADDERFVEDLSADKLQRLKDGLYGRRLLLAEVKQLAIHIGLITSDDEEDVVRMIQLLLLRGEVRVEGGMELGEYCQGKMGQGLDRKKLTRQSESDEDRSGRLRIACAVWRQWLKELYRKKGQKNNQLHASRNLRCGRCNSGVDKHYRTQCAVCGRQCTYCEACLQMGRVRECSLFIVGCGSESEGYNHIESVDRSRDVDIGSGTDIRSEDVEELLKRWSLSPAQEAASREALSFVSRPAVREGEQFLIWAVTGAGKTEMIYPLVEHMLRAGGRVLLTAPRRDVVLELAPRLAKAFPERDVVALYGGSEERWEIGEITLSTTHQLLRLERSFDLVVLDELDAYPYHHNPMLAFAVRRACKTHGKTVLLTATPPREQQLALRQHRLPHAMVPVRFHRHPLPVPRILRYRGIRALLGAGRLPSRLRAALDESLRRGAQLFVFVPRIEHVMPLTRLLRSACADAVDATAVDGTSSRDTDRANRVRRFRSGEIRILVTTTILERGVTIPRSDVFVFDADAALFDEAALVQMAGRAGRSADDPGGRVYFVARERTDGQVLAVRHIRAMNRLARKRGLLRADQQGRVEEV